MSNRQAFITVIVSLGYSVFFGAAITHKVDKGIAEKQLINARDSINMLITNTEELQDSIYHYQGIIEDYAEHGNNLIHLLDSIKFEYEDLMDEYIVDEFKLERIRYYNEIAAKKNNIKFLRGWINRVINDEE